MDAKASDPLELLFFDTFSHEINEEINLDLVQFPKPVFIGEIRIIPLGARVQADFPGGVRLGATNPSQFKIEFFINDLNKPGASSFQHLGAIDYNQNGNIHFECSRDQFISTDGLVLRGWYTTITLAVYGNLTKTTSPEPRPEMPTVEWLQHHQMDSVDTSYVPAESVPTHYGSYPVQDNPMEQEPVYSPPIRQPPPYPWPQAPPPMHTEQYERKEMYEAGSWSRRDESQHWDQRRKERHQDQYSRYDRGRPEDQSPEYDEHVSSDYATSRGSGGSQDYYGKRPKWNRDWQGNNQTPEGVIAIPMALSAKRPHTPPAPAAQPECSPSQGTQHAFAVSPGDVESISEGDIPEAEGLEDNTKSPPTPAGNDNPAASSPRQPFEPLSDDEIIDDQDVELDLSEFAEDPLKSFNVYSHSIPKLQVFPDPAYSVCEAACKKFQGLTTAEGGALLDAVNSVPSLEENKEAWVEAASHVTSMIVNSLPHVATEIRDKLMDKLVEWVAFGLSFDEAYKQPRPAMKLRHIKVGIKLVETICECGEEFTRKMIVGADCQSLLLSLFHCECMALVIKLMILRALDATLRYKSCVRLFVEKNKKGTNGYEQLLDMLQTNHHARIKFALNSLIHKLHLYDLIIKLRSSCLQVEKELAIHKNEDGEIDDNFKCDEEFYSCALEEIFRTFVNAKMLLTQPKRFLPVGTQFEINTIDFPDPYPAVFRYFRFGELLKNFVILLNLPSHSVIMPINNMIAELLETDNGMRFLCSSDEINDIISLLCGSLTKNTLRVNPTLGLHLAYRLRALSYLDELSAFDIESAEPDSAPMLEVLQGLYNLTLANIGNIGKSSVVHVVSQAGYLDILLKLIKKKETKKRSPSRGYVSDIISLCFKFTSSVTFAQKYCTEICDLVAANFPEMQDVQLWLKPYKDMSNEVAAACEILKSSVDSCTALPPKIICAIRLLKFLSIPKSDRDLCPMQFDGEYDELKYKFNVLQIYSLDGLTSLTLMLQKLTKHYEQPYLYSSRLIGRQGLLLVAFVLPAVQLLRRMLIYVIQVRNTEFKDLTAVPVLLQTFALMQAVPINGQAHTDALRVCREIVETLLAYTQPIYSKDSSENDALNKSLWTQMMSEVLKYTIEYPTNFVSGLMVLSELLPLPLPLQCRVALLPAEATKLANSRRLWSAHLHSLSSLLESMIALTSMSNCHPLLQILRRVCVQLSDLAAPTAQIVVRTLCDAILPLLEPPKMDSSLPRLLNFLARLMTHGSIKATFLFIVNTIEKYQSMITLMTDIFKIGSTKVEWEQSQECLASILLSISDTEISLVPPTSFSPETHICHALPSREALHTVCNALLDHLLQPTSYNTCLTAMRTFILLVEHDFGFFHVKQTYDKRPSAIHNLFARINKEWSKDNHDLLATLSATLDFLRALACLEGVEYSLRKNSYTLPEMLHLIQWTQTPGHPLHSIEENLKGIVEEDETLEPLLENVSSFIKILDEDQVTPVQPREILEPQLPACQPLLAQFALRNVYVLGQEIHEERLAASYWLAPPNPDEPETESDLVLVDLGEIAQKDLNGFNHAEAMSQLFHRKSEGATQNTREEKKVLPCEDTSKKSYPAPARGRNLRTVCGVGRTDTFRSRPPNTSRPPSLHVDDFVALETCGGPPLGRPANLSSEKVVRARGRGRTFGMDRGGRYFGAHPTYHREPVESVWDRGMYGGGPDLLPGGVAGDPGAIGGRFGRSAQQPPHPPPMATWGQGGDSRLQHPPPTDRGHLHPNFFQR